MPNGDPGWPDTPASVISCPACVDGIDDEVSIDPLQCKHFIPRPAGVCTICQMPLDEAAYKWPLWEYNQWEDLVPVCSDKCKQAAYLKRMGLNWYELIENWKFVTGQKEYVSRYYCPDCNLEMFPFDDESIFWISDSSERLYALCKYCENRVHPREYYVLVTYNIPYSTAKKLPRSRMQWR